MRRKPRRSGHPPGRSSRREARARRGSGPSLTRSPAAPGARGRAGALLLALADALRPVLERVVGAFDEALHRGGEGGVLADLQHRLVARHLLRVHERDAVEPLHQRAGPGERPAAHVLPEELDVDHRPHALLALAAVPGRRPVLPADPDVVAHQRVVHHRPHLVVASEFLAEVRDLEPRRGPAWIGVPARAPVVAALARIGGGDQDLAQLAPAGVTERGQGAAVASVPSRHP